MHRYSADEFTIGRNPDMQPGEVPATFADVSDLERAVGHRPSTTLDAGIRPFVAWYRPYYQDAAEAARTVAATASV